MRIVHVLLIAALALTAAGCGAKEKAAAGGGAEIVPAGAPIFISIDSDLGSGQWQAFDDLLRSFPGRPQLLALIRASLRDDTGLDYERDIKPALGEEIDIVWLDFEAGGTNVVGLAKPKDEGAFRRMIAKHAEKQPTEKLLVGEVDGWLVLADEQAKLDRFREETAGGDKLADSATFKDAMGEVPDEALVTVYAGGDNLVRALERVFNEFQGVGGALPFGADGRLDFITAALAAESDGLRLTGAARTEQEPPARSEPFSSKLVHEVPGDAVAFLTFQGDSLSRQAGSSPTYERALRQFQRMFGLKLEGLLELFEHEVAFYVRPGTPLPEFTLLLEAPNEQAALKRVRTVLRTISRFTVAQPCHEPKEQAGVPVDCVDFGKLSIRAAAFDGRVVVTTGQGAIRKLRSGGPKLADDARYEQARKVAGIPDETPGFLWVDIKDVLPMIFGFVEAGEVQLPPDVRANLEPLQSLLVWGELDGRTSSFSAFLQID